MVTNDATILRLKHDVLYEVAKAAWEGNLEEKRDEIPYDMIPGPQASYRCCIYKEREDHQAESPSGRRQVPYRKRQFQCGSGH